MKALAHINGDIFPDRVVSDLEAVRVCLQDRLSIIKGEYLPNVMLGIPLGARKEEIDLSVQQIVLGTSGVVSILEFSSYFEGKVYRCRFVANTAFGRLVYG